MANAYFTGGCSKVLGFVGYYRRFVKDFSKIARPLSNLLPSPIKKKGIRKSKHQKSNTSWNWTSEGNAAFETLKQCLIDFTKPFELHTNA